MKIMQKDTITSLEVLEQINFFRKKERDEFEGNDRLLSDMEHKNLLSVIRDELDVEIGKHEVKLSEYKTSQNKNMPMYVMKLKHAKRLLMKESKVVRRAVTDYIEELEYTIRAIQDKLLDKKQQLEAMKKFGSLLPEIEAEDSLPYVKINTCVNKATSNYFGFPKMIKKDEMTSNMLVKRSEIMNRFLVAYELFKDITKAKEFIYEEFQQPKLEFEE